MSSSIKLKNANGKIVTITNPDTTSADVAVDLLNNAYTIATVDDFGTVPVGYTTVIVKDTDRGGVFNRIASTTANGGTIFDGTTGYSWERQYDGAVNVKWFGAKGDGITDDTVAIQNAINVSSNTIHFQPGVYGITYPLTWTKTIRLVGEGKVGVVIKALSSMEAMISASIVLDDTNLTSRSSFEGLVLLGNSLANYGIRGVTNHTTFDTVRVNGTLLAAMQIGYGWANYFVDCELSYNKGDGLDLHTLGNQANGVTLSAIKSFNNGGWGYISAGLGTKFINCIAEACKKGGMFFPHGSRGVSLDTCYFEANGEIGHTFTSPETVTVKSDIVINGASPLTSIAAAFPSTISITNCFVTSNYTTSFVFAPGAEALDISMCTASLPTTLVKYYGSGTVYPSYGYPTKLKIKNNVGFSSNIEISPITANILEKVNESVSIDGVNNKNIALLDMNQWKVVVGGGGGTFYRSATLFDKDPSLPVWEIVTATAMSSHFYGFSIDCTKYPYLHNKLVTCGFWINNTWTGDGGTQTYMNSTAGSSSYNNTPNVWKLVGATFIFPTTGVKHFSIRNIGAAGATRVTAPVLSELGSDINSLANYLRDNKVFYGSAAPTAGTWEAGDLVYDTTPSASANIGWVCTASGTPGTWKTFGAISA